VADKADWDCIVVGGGAAGLSAALVLGRARRPTLLVDAGEPSNAPAHGIGGLLGFDGRPPAELYARGREELAAYPDVSIHAAAVVGGSGALDAFTLELDDGTSATARRVLLATGMEYRYPDLPGADERWGRSVFHCPFCHGWEVRDRHVGLVDKGATALHRGLLLGAWTDRITLLTNGPLEMEAVELDRLKAAGLAVDERPIEGLAGDAPGLDGVLLADGGELDTEALLVATTMHQRSDLAGQLGAAARPAKGHLVNPLEVDASLQTSVPGLYAAGDLAVTRSPSVANSVADGSQAAAMVVASLTVQA
jgi:thioredoxin reductase